MNAETATLKGMGPKVTLYLEPTAWKRFRIECMKKDVSPSELIREFIVKQLAKWEAADAKGNKDAR